MKSGSIPAIKKVVAKVSCKDTFKAEKAACAKYAKAAKAKAAKAKATEKANKKKPKLGESEEDKKASKSKKKQFNNLYDKKKKKQLSCPAKAAQKFKACKMLKGPMEISTKKAAAALKAEKNAEEDHVAASDVERVANTFQDIKPPNVAKHAVGIFEHEFLFYRVNEDGTKSWIKYPTKDCAKNARHGIPHIMFPKADKEKYKLNAAKSKIACKLAPFHGKEDIRFYKNCECNGLSNKKGSGGSCKAWGFKGFNWCYVNKKCQFGNTADSTQAKD